MKAIARVLVWAVIWLGALHPALGQSRGENAVQGFLSHGVPVNAIDHAYWRTAVHGAAAKGGMRILRYLVANGANINALDRDGDSPVELAASNGNREATEFLIERGAKRIRGDDEQREKSIHGQVEDTIKERAEGVGRPPS
jgi:hypothetical protein